MAIAGSGPAISRASNAGPNVSPVAQASARGKLAAPRVSRRREANGTRAVSIADASPAGRKRRAPGPDGAGGAPRYRQPARTAARSSRCRRRTARASRLSAPVLVNGCLFIDCHYSSEHE